MLPSHDTLRRNEPEGESPGTAESTLSEASLSPRVFYITLHMN